MRGMKGNIGVYNLHMRSLGGGEKLTLALAEHLSVAHNVWLLLYRSRSTWPCSNGFLAST